MHPAHRSLAPVLAACLLAISLSLSSADFQRLYDLALERHGQQAAATIGQWQTMIEQSEHLSDSAKLVQVNDFFNTRIRFVDDISTWGIKDYWATPLQTIGRRQGDCEDFSIAKYATLLLAGVDVNKLRITYVKADIGETPGNNIQAHMILAYYSSPLAEPLILDNLIMEIRPASQRQDLTPIYGFNSKELWVGSAGKPASNNPVARLSRWRDLLLRMEEDGIQ